MIERVVRLRAPFPWQREVLGAPERFKFALVGRRGGKSDLALHAALCGHGPTGRERRGAIRGGAICWALPTWPLASDAWDRLVAATRSAYVRKLEVERKVFLPGRGSVTVKSTDNPDGLRGPGYDGVIMDEIKDHGPKVWSEALRPTLTDREGWGLMLGTPGAIGGWSHGLFEQAKRLDGWKTWQLPSSVSPILKPAELEDARRLVGSVVYAREFEAQFISASGNMFKRAWFKYYDRDPAGYRVGQNLVALSTLRRFAVADLAATVRTHSDWSVVGIFGLTPDNNLVVLDVIRKKLEGHEFIPTFRAAVDRWALGTFFIESTAYHNALIGVARGEGLPIHELIADRDKITRAELAVATVEGGRVWLPRDAAWIDDFVTELCEFPDGKHDDQADVLAHACRVVASSPVATKRREPETTNAWTSNGGWWTGVRDDRRW